MEKRYVPEELMIEILLRLPVKSLMRFKAVEKSWYNLISSSSFINSHFLNNNDNNILTYELTGDYKYEFKLGFTGLSDESQACPRLDIDIDYVDRIHGPVNGLFLLESSKLGKHLLFLLNPATRELRTLHVPELINMNNYVTKSVEPRFIFGFDPLTNDFKVVYFWISKERIQYRYEGPINMSVYNLADNSWKDLSPYVGEKITAELRPRTDSLYLNGACYWLLKEYSGLLFERSLLSFDFRSEVIREINGPEIDYMSSYHRTYTCLFIYHDSLALFIGRYSYENQVCEIDSIDVLVMKEEGCWTKHLTLDVSLLHICRPFGVWKKNALLMESVIEYRAIKDALGVPTKTVMILYDLSSHEIKEFKIPPTRHGVRHYFIYKPSLVSLKGSDRRDSQFLKEDFCTSKTSS